jgi:predicted DsbA family dithiol-disulfide isomerase
MLVEIFADFVCPWCWVGRQRLERALAGRRGPAAELAWRPFQLNPALPAEGVDRNSYLAAKFGSGPHLDNMTRMLAEAGSEVGLDFAFERIGRTPNTLAAHTLMRLADRHGLGHALSDRLFRAYFHDGIDIGDAVELVRLAVATGLDGGEAAAFLQHREERQLVAARDEAARRSISGVPYFVFDRRYALAGAQHEAAFLPVFDALRETG